jgi:hypothetical protein
MIFVGWSSDALKNDWSPVIWDKYGARCFITQRTASATFRIEPRALWLRLRNTTLRQGDKVKKSTENARTKRMALSPIYLNEHLPMKQCMVRYKPWVDIWFFFSFFLIHV